MPLRPPRKGRHRQDGVGLLEQAVLLQLLRVAALGIAHQLHRGVVLHQGEEAVDGEVILPSGSSSHWLVAS